MTHTASDRHAWSYRPGDWIGVAADAVGVVVPSSSKDRAAALWEAADEGASFDQILDVLVSGGLSGLPSFALVGLGESTRLLVRGEQVRAIVTTAEGKETIDGSAAGTWIERNFDGVSSLRVTLDGARDEGQSTGADLDLPGGLVRLGRLDHPAVMTGLTTAPSPPEDVAVRDLPHDPLTDPLTDPLDDSRGAAGVAVPVVSGAPTDDWLAPSVTVAETEDAVEPPPEPTPEPTPPPADGDDPGAVTEMFAPVAGSQPGPDPGTEAPTIPPGTPPETDDHDGMTRGASGAEFAHSTPGIPGQPAAPSVTRTVARLTMASGDEVDVDRVILIGRNPEARRFTSTEQPRMLKVPSPLQEISSTHVEIRPGTGVDHGSAVVTDMGSTNGTVLVQPGLGPEDLKPGIAVSLLPGAVINLGDGLTIQVARPA